MSIGNPPATNPPPIPPQVQGPASPAPLPATQPATRLVRSPTEAPPLLASATTDTHEALTRGLSEYLSTVSRMGPGGRLLAFQASYSQWQEPEQNRLYPSVAVYSNEKGSYEPNQLIPNLEATFEPEPGKQRRMGLVKKGEYSQELIVDIWCTDPVARSTLLLACEEALTPVQLQEPAAWMYGVRLWLPHYYGQIATYEPTGMGYIEDQDAQLRRERRSTIVVKAHVSVCSLVVLPEGTAQAKAQQVSQDPLPSS